MQLKRQIADLQATEASEWLEKLKEGRPEDVAAFRAWYEESPVHVREFLEITWADRELEGLDPHREEDLEALLKEISPRVTALPKAAGSSKAGDQRRRPSRWGWGLAATMAAVALGLGWYGRAWLAGKEVSTKIGEQRTVELVDQSLVTLNTDSDIKIEFERSVRNIELRGEAVFKVAHDPARPFRVHTRAGVIQAVGTQFNVYDREDGTDVAVLEGRVRLTPRAHGSGTVVAEDLVAGQQARIGADGTIHRAERADVERVTAWSKRRLKFDNATLEEIVDEFNRYHQNLRLRLEGIPTGSHQYSGIFDADNPGTLARFLEQEPDLVVKRTDKEIVIRLRTEAESTTEVR